MAGCGVCFRHCEIKEGERGFCGARACRDGKVYPENYGRLTALALDPIEKKPLRRFMPGSLILSAGSYGCNLRCPFCQNHEISWSRQAMECGSRGSRALRYFSPEDLAGKAYSYRYKGNVGVAFTYNEPLIGYEYVRDSARLVREMGMKNVMVTNGTAELSVLEELTPYMDAMNIDVKSFDREFYKHFLGGDLDMVKDFVAHAVKVCHVELTTLIIPGENDSCDMMRELTGWVSELTDRDGNTIGRSIPLHISRFFPRFQMTQRDATDVSTIHELVELAREKLDHVYAGNC